MSSNVKIMYSRKSGVDGPSTWRLSVTYVYIRFSAAGTARVMSCLVIRQRSPLPRHHSRGEGAQRQQY